MPSYKTMTELATDALREGILTGRYSPGNQLIPAKLEKELGLGRVAIREGLRELTGSGLIIQLSNKGAYVANPPDIHELEAIYEARAALEGAAAYQVTLKADSTLIQALEYLYFKMDQIDLPPKQYWLLNREFHISLYRPAGWNHVLLSIVTLIDQVLSFYAHRTLEDVDFKPFNHDHRLIIDALQTRKAGEVRDLVAANLEHGRRYAKDVLKQSASMIKGGHEKARAVI